MTGVTDRSHPRCHCGQQPHATRGHRGSGACPCPHPCPRTGPGCKGQAGQGGRLLWVTLREGTAVASVQAETPPEPISLTFLPIAWGCPPVPTQGYPCQPPPRRWLRCQRCPLPAPRLSPASSPAVPGCPQPCRRPRHGSLGTPGPRAGASLAPSPRPPQLPPRAASSGSLRELTKDAGNYWGGEID